MATRRTLKQLSALKRTSRYREQTKQTTRRMNLEQLEDRRVMATGPTLVTLLSNDGVIPDGPVGVNNIVKTAPRELTLRFAEGQSIDPATIASGIKITRAGLDEVLGNANDINVAIGSIQMGDVPREVVVRFARNLPDDLYRVTLVGAGTSPLKDIFGNAVNGGVDVTRDFNLDLGAQVLSVVPQPITRNATTGALTQSNNTIEVYFNADALDMATAQNRAFYRLIDTTTGNVTLPTGVALDAVSGKATLTFASAVATGTYKLQVGTVDEPNDTILGAVHVGGPLAMFSKYLGDNPALTGAATANDVDLYRFDLKTAAANFTVALQAGAGFDGALRLFDSAGNPIGATSNATGVGQAETLTRSLAAGTYYVGVSSTGNVGYAPGTGSGATGGTTQGSYSLNVSFTNTQSIESFGNDSSFSNANDAGVLGIGGAVISAAIDTNPYTYSIVWPADSTDPGHRDLPPAKTGEEHLGGSPDTSPGIATQYFNFKDVYGALQGNPLHNGITEVQKQRAREIFELYGRYAGIKFIESPASGITVVTGDLRALDPTFPEGSASGLAGGTLAIMNNAVNWGASEYGGKWFQTAMHEIGHTLGLGHSYDLPGLTIQGSSETGSDTASGDEPVFPGDYDIQHMQTLYRPEARDIDLYKFSLTEAGRFTAETIAERLSNGTALNSSSLNTVLTLYRETIVNGEPVREIISQNDDYFSSDSQIQLNLEAGTYYIGVTASGMTGIDPNVANSGLGGLSDGPYKLTMNFLPAAASSILDTTGNKLDGDLDGVAGGAFEYFFQSGPTIYVNKPNSGNSTGDLGTIAKPFDTLAEAIAAAQSAPAGTIIRVVGNPDRPYLIGYNDAGLELADGANLAVPKNITMMIDAGSIIKLQNAFIEVGSSPLNVDASGAALQVLGTPTNKVQFTSYHDDTIGGDSDGISNNLRAGNWGGIVFRDNSDKEDKNVFLNYVNQANIYYGGGQFIEGTNSVRLTPIYTETARPTLTFNRILYSAGAAISADPNSFSEELAPSSVSYAAIDSRIGPEIYGNIVTSNSINGLFVRIRTNLGSPVDVLTVSARFDDTDIVHVITENLQIDGTPGGGKLVGSQVVAQTDARLRIDPGVIVKLEGARIEARVGSQLIAEGTAELPVIFTALKDDRYGIGGTFDTGNDAAAASAAAGQWGGLIFNANSTGSIDHAKVFYGGGNTPIEGTFASFNPVEIIEADVRIANSLLQFNANGTSNPGNRNGRGSNVDATIFVRGAQPVIVNNIIRDNAGHAISINANAMQAVVNADRGNQTGVYDAFSEFADNYGPLVRANRLVGNGTNGMQVRGAVLTTETIWDDTDIAHILRDEITVLNQHVYGGIRLQSSPAESLVVKLSGANAGFVANGLAMEIDDRIGGTIHILGQPGRPVVLTSLADDSVSAGLQPITGLPLFDTNNNGASTGTAGDWKAIRLDKYSNDRNVAIVLENEDAFVGGVNQASGSPVGDINRSPGPQGNAQFLGNLAPNEKSGDDVRRLGFEISGFIALDNPHDVDVYSFTANSGTEVWIDLDRTNYGLNAIVELVDSNGNVFARSQDQNTLSGTAQNYQKNVVLGRDFYTTNVSDPIMRVTLPGSNVEGATYYVRVRSEPTAANLNNINAGQTSGEYRMQIRLRQEDEKPGSTVRYADIRYATNGIEVIGLPYHSQLTGESTESTTDNSSMGSAQYLGNLLTSDQATISVGGNLDSSSDVDFYSFDLNYDFLQVIKGVSDGAKTVSAIFDIDYADGIARPDTTISVFDRTGKLIFMGRDSDIIDDQPGIGEGLDSDDITRGSFGKLDAYIGAAQLPAGSVGSGEADNASRRYYVAVSSNRQLPSALNAQFTGPALSPLIRLEPITSVRRIVEDHVGSVNGSGLATNADGKIWNVGSATQLGTHVTAFSLTDANLFVHNGSQLKQVDPLTGAVEVGAYGADFGGQLQDIVMRNDGRMFGYRNLPGVANSAGQFVEIDPGTGNIIAAFNDGIADFDPNQTNAAIRFEQITTDSVDALTYGGNFDSYQLYYSVFDGASGASRLYRADPTTGSAADAQGNNPNQGRIGNLISAATAATGSWDFNTAGATRIDFSAKQGGPSNVQVNFTTVNQGDARGPDVSVTGGNIINVVLNSFVSQASATTSLGSAGSFTFTADNAGAGGNNISLIVTKSDRAGAGTLVTTNQTPTQRIINVTLDTFGNDGFGTTAAEMLAAINSHPTAGAWVTGTLANGTAAAYRIGTQAAAITTVQLVNGSPNNAQQVATAIANSVDASALVNVSVSGDVQLRNVANGDHVVTLTGGTGTISRTTGLAFLNGTLYGVSAGGEFYRISTGDATPSNIISIPGVTGFTGLSLGPQNVEGGIYKNMFFGTTTSGQVVAFDVNGAVQQIFDTNGNGVADSAFTSAGAIGGTTGGLAFSPLDFNLWHSTDFRGGDAGHGINAGSDFSRGSTRGGESLYFGLEEFTNGGSNNSYDKFGGLTGTANAQYGILTSQFHQNLTSNPNIGNNVNLPGGAVGKMESDSFSLSGYSATDKPTVYFNYFLDTEGRNGVNGNMRDSARVFVSSDGGLTWDLIATNNSILTTPAQSAELPPALTTSTTELFGYGRQQVQELYDSSGTWRQARVDLSRYAGQSDLRFRFDFSTSGVSMDGSQEGDQYGDKSSPERGQNNLGGGFAVDDIIVGFAERGEMATGGSSDLAGFFATPVPKTPTGLPAPSETLTGSYQLEIRRAVDYGSNSDGLTSAIKLFKTYDTNDRLVQRLDAADPSLQGVFGDQNHPRQQGNVTIEQNIVTDSLNVGILVDAAPRLANGNLPFAGAALKTNVLNNDRLAPGVVVMNNVVGNYGTAGIRFSGDANAAGQPDAVSPFGRIVNNTVYGGSTARGVGIDVTDNAAPTVINNIVSNSATGIGVDASSFAKTEVNTNLFSGNNANGVLSSNAIVLAAGTPLFVNPAKRNYYLVAGSAAIDSSINTLGDRPSLTAVKGPLGIPVSTIMAPELDLYGQKRVDDPNSRNQSGLGDNIFKDRGAVERADFTGPVAKLIEPLDNDTTGIDRDPRADAVTIDEQNVPRFVIKLSDLGIGIDDSAILSSQFTIKKEGIDLVAGTDYSFVYNANTDEVTFLPATGAWELNKNYVITVDNSVATGVKDTAGNRLQGNQADGSTKFTVFIGTSFDFGDAPASYGTLKASNGASHKVVSGIYLGAAVTPETDGQPSATANADASDDGLTASTFTTVNNSSITVTSSAVAKLDMWIDVNRDGDFNDAGEKIALSNSGSLAAGNNTFTFAMPAGTTSGLTMARLRMSSAGIASPIGPAADGEVEDYQINILGPQFQNPSGADDVNGDGNITALDALIVINYLNKYGPVNLPDAAIPAPPPFLDVDGNGVLTPQDALIIINYLNSHPIQPSEGEGEGEASVAFVSPSLTGSHATPSDDQSQLGYYQVPDTLYASSSVVIEAKPTEVDASAVVNNALNSFDGPISIPTSESEAWQGDELFSALGAEDEFDLTEFAFDLELANLNA